jgi:hypothetical protein
VSKWLVFSSKYKRAPKNKVETIENSERQNITGIKS